MDFNPYTTEDKEQKVRIIIATVAIAVIVLGIASWAIIAIVGSKNGNQEAIALDDSSVSDEAPEANTPKTEGVTVTTQPTTPVVKNTTTQTTSMQKDNVPETGPEEILPFALVIGLATAYISSKKLAKNEA